MNTTNQNNQIGGLDQLIQIVFEHELQAELAQYALGHIKAPTYNQWIGVGGNLKEILDIKGFTPWKDWSEEKDLGTLVDSWIKLPVSNTPQAALAILVSKANISVKDWLVKKGILKTPDGKQLSLELSDFDSVEEEAREDWEKNDQLRKEHGWYITMTSPTIKGHEVATASVLAFQVASNPENEPMTVLGHRVTAPLHRIGGTLHFKSGKLWMPFDMRNFSSWLKDNCTRFVYVRKLKPGQVITPSELPTAERCAKFKISKDGKKHLYKVDPILTASPQLDKSCFLKGLDHVGEDEAPTLEVTDGLMLEDACVRATIQGVQWLSPEDPSVVALSAHSYSRREIENGNCALWNKYLSELFGGDQDVVEYVKRWVGIALMGLNITMQTPAIFITGEKGTGKSTLVKLVESLFPKGSVSNLSLANIDVKTGESSSLKSMVGKMLNCDTETNEHTTLVNHDTIKKVIFGEPTTIKELYRNPIEVKFTAAHLYAVNKLPKLPSGTDDSIYDRFMLIKIKRSGLRGTQMEDAQILDKLKAETPGILNDVIQAAQRALNDYNNKTQGTVKGLPVLSGEATIDMGEGDLINRFCNEWLEPCELGVASKAPSGGLINALVGLYFKSNGINARPPTANVISASLLTHFKNARKQFISKIARYNGITISEKCLADLKEYVDLHPNDVNAEAALNQVISYFNKSDPSY